MMNSHTEASPNLLEDALRGLHTSSRAFWGAAAALGLLVLMAVAAWIVQLRFGLSAAGYSDRAFWGIYEANLVAFIGVSYGGALISAILRLTHAKWRAPITRLAEAMALFSLMAGMSFALIHVGRPERLWMLVVRQQPASPLVWDFIAIMTYLLATSVFLYLPIIPDAALLRDRFKNEPGWRLRVYEFLAMKWRGLPRQRRILQNCTLVIAIVIIPLAVLVHSVLSWAFAVTGRPGWDSTIFAPYFVVGALFSGIALVVVVVAGFRWGYHLQPYIELRHFRALGYLIVVLDLLYIYFTFAEMLNEGYVSNEAIVPVLRALLIGHYAPVFWSFVFGGLILPLLIIAIPKTRTVPGIVIAAVLVVLGMWLKRMIIVVPAAVQPLIAGPWGSFTPTPVSIAITVGAAASIPLFLMLFFKLFPLMAVYEMEEIAEEAAAEAAAFRPVHVFRQSEA